MSKIAFISPDKHLFLQGQKIIREMGIECHVSLHLARLGRAIRLAKQLEAQDVDVIVCRGGTAHVIITSRVRIPVVEIAITGQDLAQVFHEAKRITGLERPGVAMLAFDNMKYDIEALSDILGIDLAIYRLETIEDIPARIKEVEQHGTDLVVGGRRTVNLAHSHGFKTHLIRSGDFSMRAAFLEAEKICQARKLEKEQAYKFKALADHSMEGIISINREKTVEVFNPAAQRLLNRSSSSAIGQKIDLFLEGLDIEDCLQNQQNIVGQTLQHGEAWLSVNAAPIIVDNHVTGALLAIQDVTQIQEVEAKIRHSVVTRRFIARYQLKDVTGNSEEIRESRRIAREFAQVDATVLIFGESGTGKELFAQGIHNESRRRLGPFVAVNCAALPVSLLESELFGYVEGAFTGATKKGKPGLFEMAHKGTIFLDEISEMDKSGQNRLLRVLQDRQVMRLGDDKYIPVDVRVVTATNKKLWDLMKSGDFRQDLYYRLKVLTLNLPPLRRRTGDIPALAAYFADKFKKQHQKRMEILPEAYEYMAQYDWPGNVRELMFFMERLIIIANEKTIGLAALKKYWDDREESETLPADGPGFSEAARISEALKHHNSNISKAAQSLGMDRSTLYRKMRSFQIEIIKSY